MSLVSVNPTSDMKIANSDFWPDMDAAEMRLAVRLDGQVTDNRLLHACREGMARVNSELAEWRAVQQAAGYDDLAGMPADRIGGESVLILRYKRAVWFTAKALLLEGYRDIDTTRDGEKHAEALTTQIDGVWRDSQWALRDIMGLPRGLAEIV
ncbi:MULTISPECIES: head completion/stabilization protein [unclassified Pantoea]|uniref:head completion/stabilization protein n=1 Tax=unclassified Pantoea TaxID=2630326 RepID=UPI001232AB97|nr:MULTISPECIES: head completion/stabilization protein [unclassified Pantoea]KAA5952047.1 head completion/stabilization protein [Pantoea sp. VH_24]KAA5953423.1 head completion/stabilization protein [Pantoea sp. VH_16]KAA5961635.1 head completion/stabilization protein [Pantoea sp. VH_18]KAA5993343.1 head completion/stabilization protein [Pantoea sp. M_1]KAA5998107.1 head completion/stabilization protein [Pantoea sp. F_7]